MDDRLTHDRMSQARANLRLLMSASLVIICASSCGAQQHPTLAATVQMSRTLLESDCLRNDLRACKNLARQLRIQSVEVAKAHAMAASTDENLWREAADRMKVSCAQHDFEACTEFALYLRIGRGVSKNRAEAASLYQTACGQNVMLACDTFALMQVTGEGVARDVGAGVASLDAQCSRGNGVACDVLALLYYRGAEDVAANAQRAVEYSVHGCEMLVGSSCFLLGSFHEQGVGDIAQNPARARELYNRACDLGSEGACIDVALALRDGDGGAGDLGRAVALLEHACSEHHWLACGQLGQLYEQGRGVPTNSQRANELYEMACDPFHDTPTMLNAEHRRMQQDCEVERDRSECAFLHFDPRSCSLLGLSLLPGAGQHANAERARVLFALSCEEEDVVGCRNAAVVFASGVGGTRDVQQAQLYYEKACALHDLGSCRQAEALRLQATSNQSTTEIPRESVLHN